MNLEPFVKLRERWAGPPGIGFQSRSHESRCRGKEPWRSCGKEPWW